VLTVITSSVAETVALGERIGKLASGGCFIALTGELGSGKTHFARGIAVGLGVDRSVPITSPTYTLMNVYDGRLTLRHFDLYRLNGDQDVAELGFEDYFYGEDVCVVEWADRLHDLLPEERMTISFSSLDDDVRSITFVSCGDRYELLETGLAALKRAVAGKRDPREAEDTDRHQGEKKIG
jgi:tRNA threonylcarbamoyladenosine biosynthesis protein TsaE